MMRRMINSLIFLKNLIVMILERSIKDEDFVDLESTLVGKGYLPL